MKADERGYLDDLTGRLLGAVFEVSNTLGARDSWRRSTSVRCSTNSASGAIRAAAEVSFPAAYKGQAVGKYSADILVEEVPVIELKMCRAALQRTHRAVSHLFASLGPESVSARQFPETEGRVEANRSRISDSRVEWRAAFGWVAIFCDSALSRQPERADALVQVGAFHAERTGGAGHVPAAVL
jgi:PD-(D/E)XK nuclease superfamily